MTSQPRGGVQRRDECIAVQALDWLNKGGVFNGVCGRQATGVIYEMCLFG